MVWCGARESVFLLKLRVVSQMHSQNWEPLVWQVLENPDFPYAPVFNKGRFSAQAPKPCWRLAGWSRQSDSNARRLRVGSRAGGGVCGSPAPAGPQFRHSDGGRGQGPEPEALRAAHSAAGVSGTICSAPPRSALCVKLPSPTPLPLLPLFAL